MKTEIFDRDTILDLVVNFIPLGIILFFVGLYLVRRPWGFDLFGLSGVMLALLVVPFLALGVLTYLSAVAIAGDERDHTVYAQGQAGLRGAKPLHEEEDEAATDDTEADDTEADEGGDTEPPVDDETDNEEPGDDSAPDEDDTAADTAASDDEDADEDADAEDATNTEEGGDDGADTDSETAADETDDEPSDDGTKPDEN